MYVTAIKTNETKRIRKKKTKSKSNKRIMKDKNN